MKTNMKTARKNCSLTQGDIASAFGFCVQTIYKWEMGIVPVPKKHWKKLASLLNITETELEIVLVETLLDACIANRNARALVNAQVSRLYRPELVEDAFRRFKTYSQQSQITAQPSSNEQTTELREQILKLREENLKLRETIIELRERCATPYRASASTPSQFTSNFENEVKK